MALRASLDWFPDAPRKLDITQYNLTHEEDHIESQLPGPQGPGRISLLPSSRERLLDLCPNRNILCCLAGSPGRETRLSFILQSAIKSHRPCPDGVERCSLGLGSFRMSLVSTQSFSMATSYFLTFIQFHLNKAFAPHLIISKM